MAFFKLNGESVRTDVDPAKPLLWVIREDAGLTGTKFGCGKALCGACTVHIDGEAQRSCSVPVGDVEGKSVLTVEGLSKDRSHRLRSEEHTSELPSLMRTSHAVSCWKKKKNT